MYMYKYIYMMTVMMRRNLFKRRCMKAETWRFGDWSSSFTRGAEEWAERHLNWTGLASRGRWRTDVKFLKLVSV